MLSVCLCGESQKILPFLYGILSVSDPPEWMDKHLNWQRYITKNVLWRRGLPLHVCIGEVPETTHHDGVICIDDAGYLDGRRNHFGGWLVKRKR
jgi:hypothetical protein